MMPIHACAECGFHPPNGPACPCITMFPNSIRKEGFRCPTARIINVKKILFALLLSLLLLLSLSAGAAEQTAAFSLSYVNGAVGGTVEVALTCDANPGISGAALNIGFDPDTLQYLDCTMAEGFDPGLFSAVETEGQLRVTFTDPYADFYETGKLLSIRFRIIGEADGDVLSTLTLSAPTGAVADVRYRSVECSVTNGGVYIGGSAIHLLPGSSYILDRESGYITGVAPQTPPAAFLQNFTGNPKVEPSGGRYIATGNAIAAGSERYTVIVTGDLNGDGSLTAADYLLTKRSIVLHTELADAQILAADITGDGRLSPSDYLMLKRIVLGLD